MDDRQARANSDVRLRVTHASDTETSEKNKRRVGALVRRVPFFHRE